MFTGGENISSNNQDNYNTPNNISIDNRDNQ